MALISEFGASAESPKRSTRFGLSNLMAYVVFLAAAGFTGAVVLGFLP